VDGLDGVDGVDWVEVVRSFGGSETARPHQAKKKSAATQERKDRLKPFREAALKRARYENGRNRSPTG